ncbi:MAG: hypothetical protein SF097_21060 [Acidobacteriota bacterium]|nr:hypothetical protein [Acidobacteriota bacterium]
MTIALAPEVEQRIQTEAARVGLPADRYIINLLDEYFARQDKVTTSEDDNDYWEKEFFERLDAERPEGQKLFPPELKGITW